VERFAMVRTTSGLPRSLGKWVSQVSASAGATLIATMIYGALPRPAAPPPAPRPEMTSGGKFAARVDHAPSDADGGLDTMPLPHVAAHPTPAAFLVVPVSAEVSGFGGADEPAAAGQPSPAGHADKGAWVGAVLPRDQDRGLRTARIAKSATRSEAKAAAAPAASEPPARMPAGAVAITLPAPDVAQAAGGLLTGAMSTARDAWTFTASTSGALVSHLIP